ncbi:MAG: hypothetical protein ABSC36_04120 [Gaiellaceae bacterium]|jgi:hypothetical protein
MKYLIAIAACCLVTAGTATGLAVSGSKEKARTGICANRDSVRRTEVTRTGSPPNGRGVFAFPAQVTLGDAARARVLAAAICGLPRIPGAIHCPIDFSLRYVVHFDGFSRRISIDPFGCETVTGAGPVRWVTLSPGVWRKLGQTLGLPTATLATFRGRKT